MSDDDNSRSAASLPVTWKANGKEYAGRPLIAQATKAEEKLFTRADPKTCADCRHFRLEDGQNAMKKQRFLERIVREEQWKTKYMGSSPETFGFCNRSDALASMFAPACDQYKPANGRLRIVR